MLQQRFILGLILLAAVAVPTRAGEVVAVAALAPEDGQSLRLTLGAELGGAWREANVGRVAIRSPGGQRRLAGSATEPTRHLDLTLPAGDCALVVVELGPGTEKGHPDSWRRTTHASKIVACPATGDALEALEVRLRAGAAMMDKAGGRIEIRPLANPALIAPGSDLPVRLYFDNAAQPGAEVTASGPGDLELRATADAEGIANLTLPTSGRWVIRYRALRRATRFVAELEVEVLPESFWSSLGTLGGER